MYIILGVFYLIGGFVMIRTGGFGLLTNAVFCLIIGLCAFFAAHKRNSCLALVAFVMLVRSNRFEQFFYINVQIIIIVLLIIGMIALICVFLFVNVLVDACNSSSNCSVDKSGYGGECPVHY